MSVAAMTVGTARRFLIYSRGGQFAFAGLACMVVANVLFPWATESSDSWQLSPVGAVVVVGALLFAGRWLTVGGSVTVDTAGQRIEWRRPLRGQALSQTWRFDQVVDARVVRKGGHDVVRLELKPARELKFVCARGAGEGVIASIRDDAQATAG